MKKLMGFILISFLILVIRYFIALVIVNFANDFTKEEEQVIVLPSEVLQKTNLFKTQDGTQNSQSADSQDMPKPIAAVTPMLAKYKIEIPPVINSSEFNNILKMLLASALLGATIMYLKKISEQLWLYEDREYLIYALLVFFPAGFIYNFDPVQSGFLMFSTLAFLQMFNKKYKKAAFSVGMSIALNCLGLMLLIPFFYYAVMNEKYNTRFKLVPKSINYLITAAVPTIVFAFYLSIHTGTFSILGLSSMAEAKKFLFIPLGYFFSYYQTYAFNLSFSEILQMVFLLIMLVLLIVEFVKLFLVFEFKTNEQNALFIYTALFTLLYSSSLAGNNVIQGLGLCVSSFIIPSIALNIPLRSVKFMTAMLLFISVQTLLFINYLLI
jgi:hypothetical protein